MKKLFCVFLLGVTFLSCEKVIDIPLESSEQQLVVEAVMRSFEEESYVMISKTGSVYAEEGFEMVSGAVVVVTDSEGNETLFVESLLEPGRYISPGFVVEEGMDYAINVKVEGKEITSQATAKTVPEIDSLSYFAQYGSFGSEDTTYLVFYHYKDVAGESNYYRIRAKVNGVQDGAFYLGDDALGEGGEVTAPLFGTSVGSGDTVLVELQSVDKRVYKYLTTLASNVQSGPFTATPANPVSNLSEGLGYFGVYTLDTATIILP